MWNEMVKDEEITFNGEESAHPGKPLTDYSIHLPRYVFFAAICLRWPATVLLTVYEWYMSQGYNFNLFWWTRRLMSECLVVISEDCTDCFGTQKKDEPNDKEKKEEEETSTSVHHSIIETWDWGRQPGESATCTWTAFRYVWLQNISWPTSTTTLLTSSPVLSFYAFLFPSRVINTMLTADGFTTPKCRLDTVILTVSTHGQPLCLSISRPSGLLMCACFAGTWVKWLAVRRSAWLFLPLWV